MTVASRMTSGWTLTAPEPVGPPGDLIQTLLTRANGGPVVLGADLPIGLPRAYAATRPESDFPTFLRNLAVMPDFFQVCATLEEIRHDRPFYPARGVRGMTRLAHALALGFLDAAGLSRMCDKATSERPAGAPLFWTLGANQSGKAAISAWQTLILPALPTGRLRLWPFEGPLLSLLVPGQAVLAETYPAEALRHLGIKLKGSKRRQADRIATADALLAAMALLQAIPAPAMQHAVANGFGADAAGEDRFDSVLGVLAVLNVAAGNRPDTAPSDPWIQRWEGWVLGQTALPAAMVASRYRMNDVY